MSAPAPEPRGEPRRRKFFECPDCGPLPRPVAEGRTDGPPICRRCAAELVEVEYVRVGASPQAAPPTGDGQNDEGYEAPSGRPGACGPSPDVKEDTAPTLLDRIRELSTYDGEGHVCDFESISYTWSGGLDGSGYETFETKLREGGSCHYSGVYHPDDGYCVGNPCRYCGHTVIDWDDDAVEPESAAPEAERVGAEPIKTDPRQNPSPSCSPGTGATGPNTGAGGEERLTAEEIEVAISWGENVQPYGAQFTWTRSDEALLARLRSIAAVQQEDNDEV